MQALVIKKLAAFAESKALTQKAHEQQAAGDCFYVNFGIGRFVITNRDLIGKILELIRLLLWLLFMLLLAKLGLLSPELLKAIMATL